MSKQKEDNELQQVLNQLTEQEQKEQKAQEQEEQRRNEQEAQKAKKQKEKEAKKQKRANQKKRPELTGWKQQCTTGLPALFIDTLILFLGTFLFGLLYKAFVAYEVPTTSDAYASIIFYVSPITGTIGILLLLALKCVYDIRFYRIQDQARQWREKLKRVTEWVLYILFMLVLEVFIFINYSCGIDFFDTYTFENEILGNIVYTLLYIVIPFVYPMEALIRLIRRRRDPNQKGKKKSRR